MTDTEREAQIHKALSGEPYDSRLGAIGSRENVKLLLRLLKEARAEIARLASTCQNCGGPRSYTENPDGTRIYGECVKCDDEASEREALIARLRAEIASRDTVISEMQRTFDLMWDADQRGIKAWQEANPGNDMVWPDRAKHMQWILEQIASLQAPPGASSLARDLAFTAYLYDLGESGVMTINPNAASESFTRFWDGDDATAEANRERWKCISRAAYRAIEQAEANARLQQSFSTAQNETARALCGP